jgi:hypothetical protein
MLDILIDILTDPRWWTVFVVMCHVAVPVIIRGRGERW